MGSRRGVDPSDRSDPAHREISSYESSLAPDDRKQRGVHYTPPELARYLVGRALSVLDGTPRTVCDPTCGGGTFLLAAAEAMADAGVDPVEIVTERLFGADVDPDALELTRKVLVGWAESRTGRTLGDVEVPGLAQADLLVGIPPEWSRSAGFDLIVGNPPFLSQLRSRTTRSADETRVLRDRFGEVGTYADTAALIFLGSVEMLAEGGVATMIQPQSFLASRDTSGVRDRLLEQTGLLELWSSDASYFDAAVSICAVSVARLSAASGQVSAKHANANLAEVIWRGSDQPLEEARHSTTRRPEPGESWGLAFAPSLGVPVVERTGGLVLGDVAAATAGFRDEFYALVEACEDSPSAMVGPRLVTVGMIDPCHLGWGVRGRRLGGLSRLEPRLNLARLESSSAGVHRWAADRLVPKVLIATQTRIVEAAVDLSGDCVPVTPVISVEPLPGWEAKLLDGVGGEGEYLPDIWWLLAAISAPSVAARAVGEHLGTGLSSGAIRVSAKSALKFELPVDYGWWARGAEAARVATVGPVAGRADALADLGRAMCLAHGHDPGELFDWWFQRASATCLTRGAKIV